MFIAINFAAFVDNVLLISSFVVSIDAVSVEVSPLYFKLFPPTVNQTRYRSAFSGLISATTPLYAIFPFGI